MAERFLCLAQIVDEVRVPKCRSGAVRSHRKQLLISLVGKIRVITRCGNETTFAIYTDRNHDTAEGLVGSANLVHYFLARNLARDGEPLLQPFRKCTPSVAANSLDGLAHFGIAQAHKGEIKAQRFD